MMKKPLILVTNDDGMFAPGIKALVDVARTLGDVIVVAPNSPQSGMGHAITISDPLRLKRVDPFDGIEAYECTGTPVDCVKLANSVLLKDKTIDLCVSGINHGSNAAINILYSGTMSAAMEASLVGVDSIGFSLLDFSIEANFENGKPFVKKIIEHVLANGIPHAHLLNVNIPNLATKEIKGIKVCRQAEAMWVEEYTESKDPREEKYYWLTGKFINKDTGDDTDVWALENGYISVVPSMHDLTKYETIPEMRELER